MIDLRDRLSLEVPIVQAGMGGGVAGPELAAAVARAGGLGTLGMLGPGALAAAIARVRALAPGRPVAVNLLVPFVRPSHAAVCAAERVTAVTLFFGFAPAIVARLRAAGVFVLHQVGTVAQARRARDDGADALVVQGREAGGHLIGVEPAAAALAAVAAAVPDVPLLLAGGVARAADVRAARRAGAAGVACGSRFLLSAESRAHPEWQRRALGAARTLETELFGLGWPARHRVLPNAATERWCRRTAAGPAPVRWLNGALRRLERVLPTDPKVLQVRQRLGVPLYTPLPPLAGDDDRLVEVSPLYAGTCVREIAAIAPAESIVAELGAGW